MPVMDGLEATTQIRKFERIVGISAKIYGLTGGKWTWLDGGEESRRKALEVGMDDLVLKPMRMDKLKEIVA